MKCRICARECPPGAKICRDCAAARKRAFAATVTQPLLAAAGAPSVGQPRFAPRPIRQRRANRPTLSPRTEPSIPAPAERRGATASLLSAKWLVIGAAIAIAIAFVVIKILASDSARSIGAVAEEKKFVAASVPPADSAGPDGTPGSARDSAVVLTPNNAVRDAGQSDRRIDAVAEPKNALAKSGARKTASKVEVPSSAPSDAPPAPKPEPAVAAARTPPPRAIETARDPWQAMNEALARCAREDFFSRIACERRLRQQYCANHWGVVPQCPIGPTTDHGQ
jgi:hypothetical protein